MEFRVLGPIELWSADRQHDLGPARERCVLAILLLTPGTTVPADTLIDRLWDARPPAKARESLSAYIARLRGSLRQAVGDSVQLVGRARGYLLDVDPEAVDLHQFRRLRRQAGGMAADGGHHQADALLREADRLWRGQALAGIDGGWVTRMRDSLEEERRAAILERVECELALGRHADLVGELHHLLVVYPLDETFIAYQMTALYRSGRPGDALSLYRETRSRLVEEQGTEPGPALAELHQRILRRDSGLAAPSAERLPARLPRPDTLPPETTEFVGRSEELGLLTGEPGAVRISVTEGMPGVGKTALPAPGASLEWVAAFDLSYRALEPGHRQLFRRLGLSPCPQISPHAAAALGGCTLAEAEEAIAVLLDHHLLTRATGGQFRFHDLVRGYAAMRAARDDSPQVHRQALGRLFDYYLATADEADRVLYPFRRRMPVSVTRPPATTPAVATQEKAAAWLEAEWRNVRQAAQYAARHEWKRKCADLIHALAGFLRLRAYWDEAIAAQTLALQASRDIADPGRIAQAELELCEVSQETGRHEETLPLAEDAASIYRSQADRRGEAHALDQIGMAHARVTRYREALAYFHEARIMYDAVGDQHGVADALSHAGIASWHLGRHSDAKTHLAEALSRYRAAGDRRGEAKTLNNLGRMHLLSGYHRDALEAYQDSLKIFAEIGGAQNEAILYHNIGGVYDYKGSYEQALAAYQRALVIYRATGDVPNQADVLNDIGATYLKAECYDEALIHHEQAGLVAEEIGNQSQQVIAMRGIADVSRAWGRYNEAIDQYHKVLKLAREIGDPYEEAKILEGIGETTLSNRRPEAARILFRQALDIFERLGVPEAEAAQVRIDSLDPALGRLTS
jgi:DNA-binding SARP family transcriptional activator